MYPFLRSTLYSYLLHNFLTMKTQFFKGTLITVRKVVIVWLMGMILILAGSKVFGQVVEYDKKDGILTASASSDFTLMISELVDQDDPRWTHVLYWAVDQEEFRFRAGDNVTLFPVAGEDLLSYELEQADIEKIIDEGIIDLWLDETHLATIAEGGIDAITIRGYFYTFNEEVQQRIAKMAKATIKRSITIDFRP